MPVPGLLGEPDAVIGENGADLTGHGCEHVLQELPSRSSVGRGNELSDGKPGNAVDPDEEKELVLGRRHFGDLDVKEPDGVALELLPLGVVAQVIR